MNGGKTGGDFAPDFTIGMACFDNFDEVFFTVQALRFYHPGLIDRFEILVVDNNPKSREGEAVRALMEGRTRPNGRYVAFDKVKGSVPPRGHMIEQARGRFVICIDSHVLLLPGALQCLADYFDENPESDDFLQGPLVSNYGPHRLEGSEMTPQWRSGMFGTWRVDERAKNPDGAPFEIQEHGLGLFAVRKASWLDFHPGFSGFSGGEGYIHEKYRQAGRKCLCLPGARWVHKFSRPNGIPHRPTMEDKIRNHIRGWSELGVDLETGKTDDPIASIATHFVGGGKISPDRFSKLAAEAGVPGYVVKKTRSETGAVIGPTSWGSFGMRGKPVAERFGFDRFNSRAKVDPAGRSYSTVLAVKCDVPPALRRVSDRVIFDPLDKWFASRREADKTPAKWLADEFARNKFDDVIVATLPLQQATKRGLPSRVRVHLVPHHADPRVGLDWYDPGGPIVYAGMEKFVSEAGRKSIEAAAEKIGRRVVFCFDHHAWKALEGASLVLAPRIGLRTKLNLEGKPTVKLANAAQAGIPALATDDPAITSLFFDVRTAPVSDWLDPARLSVHLEKALGDSPSSVQFPFDRWLERMREIIA